ncbi:hypothetical protein MP228_009876 [Amoeboaphelidium protococcarum]|nr:hypothetical protein MP228_009876 [Amoeboaphelidium protococcarum]
MLNYFRIAVLLVAAIAVFYFSTKQESGSGKEKRSPIINQKRSSDGYVVTPTTGTIWWADQSVTVEWTLTNPPPVQYINVDLYSAAVQTKFFVRQLADSLPLDQTKLTFKVPASSNTGNTYIVRVWGPYTNQKAGDPNYWSLPDTNLFVISKSPVGIMNGLATIGAGQNVKIPYYIRSTSTIDPSLASIVLFDSQSSDPSIRSGIIVAANLASGSQGINSFSWNVPPVLPFSSTYQLRISCSDSKGKPSCLDETSNFEIQSPGGVSSVGVDLSSYSVQKSQILTISLSSKTGGSIASFDTWSIILSSRDASTPYYGSPLTIASDVSSSQGSYQYQVPSLPASNGYFITVYGYSQGDLRAFTAVSTDFSVFAGNQLTSGLAITLPLQNQQWTGGNLETITWAAIPNVQNNVTGWDVDLFEKDTKGSLVFVAQLLRSGQKNTTDAYWRVPVSLGKKENCVIRVTGYFPSGSQYGVVVAKSGTFKIVPYAGPQTTTKSPVQTVGPNSNDGGSNPSEGALSFEFDWYLMITVSASLILLMF